MIVDVVETMGDCEGYTLDVAALRSDDLAFIWYTRLF